MLDRVFVRPLAIDIGRTEGDVLLADDLFVSSRHARLVPRGGGLVFLRDLDTPR